jgi:hypothetical protein
MKVKLTLKLNVNQVLDLTEYGYENDVRWSDLSEDEQNDITDGIRDEYVAEISIDEID